MYDMKLTNPTLLFSFSETPDGTPASKPLVFTRAVEVVTAHHPAEVIPALNRVKAASEQGLYAAGFVAYEAAPAFDAAYTTRKPGDLPLLWFGIFESPDQHLPQGASDAFRFESQFTPSITETEYGERIQAIRNAIARGDTYQVNYTFRLRARFSGSPWALFYRCTEMSPPPFGACLDLGRFAIVSLSPELFFRTDGRRIVTRPMKGTAPRGRFLAEDQVQQAALHASEKNRAENVMIVDLLRNDVGRVAELGSVRVDSLFDVEVYPSTLQMTSTISALLRPGCTWVDAFVALFPCGSITGAPKASTMAHIAALEADPRGVYCGAIGYIAPGGRAVFNVAIRTLTIDQATGTAEYGTGGGITWDSESADEYVEAVLKTRALTHPQPHFQLIETLRLEDGRYGLFERHLARLTESARYFRFAIDPDQAKAKLVQFAAGHAHGRWRVRLLAGPRGDISITGQPLQNEPEQGVSRPVALARTPVSSTNPFLFHKTTLRDVYEKHRREFPNTFDVLLWNEKEEVTEFTIGNLVVDFDGNRYTPPWTCGLLAGTLRDELLERGEVRERMIRVADLRHARQMWFINSVRGWVPVHLI
jgi:para-aminobenzoate synthetase/4-amino-4-deoxychorismate lyase